MTSAIRLSTRHAEIGTLYFVALLREQLGERIKTARVGAGMTQRELAERIHLKNATDVSRYERGIVEVPSHRIDLIAEATGRPRSYFTRDPAEPEPDLGDDDERFSRLEARIQEQLEEQAAETRAALEQALGDAIGRLLAALQPGAAAEAEQPSPPRKRGGKRAA